MPQNLVSDLWEFRTCFHRHFKRPPHFLAAEDGDLVRGLLPLCWIDEAASFGYFPGETWKGKTWLEQNRFPGECQGFIDELPVHCPPAYHIRYLIPPEGTPNSPRVVDETGYLFLPPAYDYNFDNYLGAFSRRSAKRLKRKLADFHENGVQYRLDHQPDFELLVSMNTANFGSDSYFHDPRFRESFRALTLFLHEKGWLRLTTVLIGGEPAAVDMGCIYRGAYTLLAGGTNPDHPGVAKLINVFHMRRACEERLAQVDFLCGDFCWKTLFHLTPRPLYLLSNETA
jgi:hypothetical protein